jgi:hypothetical protein
MSNMRKPDGGEGQAKQRHTLMLTPTCWARLKEIAILEELPSRTEALEFWVREYPGVLVMNAVIEERDRV